MAISNIDCENVTGGVVLDVKWIVGGHFNLEAEEGQSVSSFIQSVQSNSEKYRNGQLRLGDHLHAAYRGHFINDSDCLLDKIREIDAKCGEKSMSTVEIYSK